MGFILKKSYYSTDAHEWNLPAGHTCPGAGVCRAKADKKSGRVTGKRGRFSCYAVRGERYPSVRASRWENLREALSGSLSLPTGCRHVRVHASGDFFSQSYFDLWVEIAAENPSVEFWAFTKSLPFWVNRLGRIPGNLELTASRGGLYDGLIDAHGLKNADVYNSLHDIPEGVKIQDNDDLCRDKTVKRFGLLNNHAGEMVKTEQLSFLRPLA